MKKVLFISYYFPPALSVESTMAANLTQYLPEFGWEPIVLSAHVPGLVGTTVPTGIDIVRVPSRPGWRWRLLNHFKLVPDDMAGWQPAANRAAQKALQHYPVSAVVSRSNPITSHLVARQLKARHPELPWIALWGDPWTQNPYARYSLAIQRNYHLGIERDLMSAADKVALTTPQTQRLIDGLHKAAGKTGVLPNTYNPDDAEYWQAHTPPPSGPFVLTYTGSLYGLRSPKPLFRAIAQLQAERPRLSDELRVQLVGPLPQFVGLINRYGVSSVVKLVGQVPRAQALSLAAQSHALLIIDAPSMGESIFMPAKLADYLISGKPILAITPAGATADVIAATQTGITASPTDVVGIKSALAKYISQHQAGLLTISPNVSEIERYSARQAAGQLAQWLNDLSEH